MPQNLRSLDGYVRRSQWPRIACPVCGDGFLAPEVLNAVESAQSERARENDSWEPDWITGTFHGLLKCGERSCSETVVVAGDYMLGPDVDKGESWYGEYEDHFRLRFALPAFIILTPPPDTPEVVTEAIKAASQVLWTDPSAAANRLRYAVEELLTCLRIRRTTVTTKHQRTWLTTHARIEEFKRRNQRNKPAGEALEAVKWIGNSGSHEDTATVSDVLDGSDMLGRALHLIYDRTERELQRRIASVNKTKGVPKKRATTRGSARS